jgi:predicted ATPase
MLTQLRLQNFKTWQDTGSLRLAPITVFFGGNSSGKSSIGQLLFTLRRTVEQPDRNLVFHTVDDRNPVDLGNYAAYIHDHDEKRDLQFELAWNCAREVELADPIAERRWKVRKMSFAASIGINGTETVVSKEFRYAANPRTDGTADATLRLLRNAKGQYDLTTTGYDAVRKVGRPWPLPKPGYFHALPDEALSHYQNATPLLDLQTELERALKSLHYLGPLREYPRRHYPWLGQTPGDVGYQGENSIAALLGGKDRKLQMKGRRNYQALDVVVADWLKTLGVVRTFRLERQSPRSRDYQVLLAMPGTRSEVTIADVGFGVSQVLPVVVQAFFARPHTTVIIEQPELHLHPAVQRELADLFIAAIQAREVAAARDVQFLIESHSEHFLRRLQLRLAQERIAPTDVALYFCERSADGHRSVVRSLQADEFGRIKNWPKNFFGDQVTDIAQMTLAGIEREAASE